MRKRSSWNIKAFLANFRGWRDEVFVTFSWINNQLLYPVTYDISYLTKYRRLSIIFSKCSIRFFSLPRSNFRGAT